MSTVTELLHGVTAVWTIYSNLFHPFFLSSQKRPAVNAALLSLFIYVIRYSESDLKHITRVCW